MASIENIYKSIAKINGLHESLHLSRKHLKSLLETELGEDGIEFTPAKSRSESHIVSLKIVKDTLLVSTEISTEAFSIDVRILYSAAKILRSVILKSKQ